MKGRGPKARSRLILTIATSQIYFANLNPVQGRKQSRERPVLALSFDTINLSWMSFPISGFTPTLP